MNMIIGYDKLSKHPAVGHANRYISVSRVETFEQCELKFWHAYVNKTEVKGETDTSKADLGHLVHGTNELVYNWVLEEEFKGVIPDEIILKSFRQAYAEHERGLKGVASYEEAFALAKGFFDRYPDIDHWDILSTEQEFLISLAHDIDVKGYMDLAMRPEEKTVEVIDYKTNAWLYTEEELRGSLQACLYLLVAEKLWPWAENFRFRFEMLRHGQAQTVTYSKEKLRLVEAYLIDITRHMERTWPEWPANPNVFCGWCKYRGLCKSYQDMRERGDAIAMVSEETDLLGMSKRRERLVNTMKVLDKQKKEYDKVLKAKMKAENLIQLRLGETTYKTTEITQTAYPTSGAVELLARYSEKSETEVLLTLTEATLKKKNVDTFIAALDLPKKSRMMLTMELLGIAETVPLFSRFEGKTDKRPELKTEEEKKLEAEREERERAFRASLPPKPPKKGDMRDDLKCSFCQKSPAKEVTRAGADFTVCAEHARKRKPPELAASDS